MRRMARTNVVECLEVRTLLAAPVAIDGAGNPNQNKAFSGTVAPLVSDPDGGKLTTSVVTDPTHGTLTLVPAGTFTYTPELNYTGPDSFTFKANDGTTDSNVAAFKLNVKPSVAPVAKDGSATPNENKKFNGTVAPLATDANGDTLTLAPVAQPTHGTLTLAAAGTFAYTPDKDYVGPDSFTFKANDGALDSNVATLKLDVKASVPPVAKDGNATASENKAFNGTVVPLVTNPNGDTLTYATVAAPTHGILNLLPTGTFTYSAAPDYVGPDSFTFKANDGTTDSNVATFAVNVKAVVPPVAIDGSGSPNENVAFAGSVASLAIDADGDKLTFSDVVLPTHGTLDLASAGTFTYVPDADYNGPDSFTFKANDGIADSNVATFALTISPAVAPVAVDGAGTAKQNLLFSGTVVPLVTDANGQKLIFAAVKLPDHGKLSLASAGTFTYTPELNYIGPDAFTFKATDGIEFSNVATFKLEVKAVNAPQSINGSAKPDEDVAFSGSLVALATDANQDKLTFTVVDKPANGTLTLDAAGTFTYTSKLNYNGPDKFTFKANDGTLDSNLATFDLNVSPVNDPLKLVLNSTPPQIARNTGSVRIDPTATVGDVDTTVNFANTKIRVSIFSGNSKGDNQKSRVILTVLGQTPGPGAVSTKSSKIYFDDGKQPVATFSGGVSGHALTIKFSKSATEQAVNAVLKQISVRLSKDAVLGTRSMQYTVTADRQITTALKSLAVI